MGQYTPPSPEESASKTEMPVRLTTFWQELKRRKVMRVAVTYAIVGWLVMQIGAVVFPNLGIPQWVLSALIVLVLLGFPIALIITWAFELTPDGIKTTRHAREEQGERPLSEGQEKKRNWFSLLFAAAVPSLIFGALAIFFYFRSPSPLEPSPSPHQVADLAKSIAVLPLANMSPDPENAFFADGVHEDVLTNLSRIKDLLVIGRTSTLQYRDTVKTLQQIGEELGVRYLVEGSVRRARNHVLVTVQLIDAQTEGHLWAENYSRELDDIFAIQAEVAKAIAGQLQAVLSPEEIEKIEYRPTENQEAYDAYVQARQLRNTRGRGARPQRVGLLEKAVELDPDFGLAWYLLAVESLALGGPNFIRGDPTFDTKEERLAFAHKAMREAERLLPDTPEVLFAQSQFLLAEQDDPQAAIKRLLDVLAIDPDFVDANYTLSNRYEDQGRYLEAEHYAEATLRKDPIQAQTFRSLALINIRMHNWEKASYYLKQRANAFSMVFGDSEELRSGIRMDELSADYLSGEAPESILSRVKDARFNSPWFWYFICGDAQGVLENTTPEGAGQIFSLDASCGVFLVPVGIEAVTVQGGADG